MPRVVFGTRSPRGRWTAVIDRVYDGIAAVTEVGFEDGSRWAGLHVAIPEGTTPDEAVGDAIQSLIDVGEFEDCVEPIE